MSIVPGATLIVGSAAGSQLAQSSSASSERAGRDAATSDRSVASDRAADAAAGIGQTQADEATGDRDADGRRLWEAPTEANDDEEAQGEQKRPPRDPRGEAGNTLDLIG